MKRISPSRRVLLETMLGLGVCGTLHAALDTAAWRAYETVEEAWIRDRFELLIEQAPGAANAARFDLDIKLADLKRRGLQFQHLQARHGAPLRGGVWQMATLPLSDEEEAELVAKVPEYRKATERIRQLSETLRRHPQYHAFNREQIRLWKTPQYREIHRRYMGRMQELQRLYGSEPANIGN